VPRYRKSVLLVDDSPADLILFKRLLEKAGFKVIATSRADAAMSKIVAGDIGCLVTDQLMPISGQELVSLARGVRSDIGVIFLSGADVPRQPLPPGAVFISKNNKHALVETVMGCMSRFKAA
jgi:FixJ family two-component response regulator